MRRLVSAAEFALAIGAGAGVRSGLNGPWTAVNRAASPFTAGPADRKFLADSTAGPLTINLASALQPFDVIIGKDVAGQSAVNPITFAPTGVNASVTIEDPSNPVHFGASARIASQGSCIWWQYDTSVTPPRLVIVVGV